MTRRSSFVAWAVLAALLVPLMMGPVPVSAQYRKVETDSGVVESRSTGFFAPAVGEQPDGTLVGVAMEMETTVRTGSGGVFLDTRPLTQLDMQGSARLAATMASSISGTDFTEYDFEVKVRSPTTAVGGPSAGGAMTVAFTALLLDVPIRGDVMMTGMINPDGSIGPVGGIIQKAEAADARGARTFLIPEGQGTVRHVERVLEGSQVREEETEVDVAEYARDRWGLEVREVSDVHEAFRFVTDHRLERPVVPEATRSPVFDEVMGEAAEGQLGEADDRHDRAVAALGASGLEGSQPQLHADLEALLGGARDRLDRAHDVVAASPYTASSLAFQSSVEISRVEVWIDIMQGEGPEERLLQALDRTDRQLSAAVGNASGARLDGLVLLEMVGAAQVRATEADRLLDTSQEALQAGQVGPAVQALAFARERVRSVQWWLSMADAIEARVDLTPLEADPEALARQYRQVAREAVTYAEVLGGQVSASGSMAQLLETSTRALRDSQQAQQDGLPAGALYLAVESQVAAHAALSLLGSESLIDDRLKRQHEAALVAVEEARRLGLEPFLAASFLEFAQALAGQDAVSALLLYGNAAMIGTLSVALAGGERQVFGIGGPSEPPLVDRVGGLGPDPWTGFFALATILFGFMAGILVTLIVVQARSATGATGPPRRLSRSRRGVALPAGTVLEHPQNGGPVSSARRRAAQAPPIVSASRSAEPSLVLGTRRAGLK